MMQEKIFHLTTEAKENATLVAVSGIFNSTSTLEIKPVLLQLAEKNNILLDLSGITMLTSAGVGTLFELADATSRFERKLILINPSERVRQVINLTGFNEMFQFAATPDEALAMLKSQ